jgi:hypothetical protein
MPPFFGGMYVVLHYYVLAKIYTRPARSRPFDVPIASQTATLASDQAPARLAEPAKQQMLDDVSGGTGPTALLGTSVAHKP